MLYVLEFEDTACLAIYHTKLLRSDKWKPTNAIELRLQGLNLDIVWENIVTQIGEVKIEQGNTLDNQLEINEQREKIEKQIKSLEKKARSEKQPRKKFELVQEVCKLKKGMKD